MDEAGIDVQVISHGAPSTQRGPADRRAAGVTPTTLAQAIAAHPDRFAGFAALPTPDPKAAADELERTVTTRFKGAMVHGLTACSSMTSNSGLSSSGPRPWTCHCTYTRPCPIVPSSRPTTRTT